MIGVDWDILCQMISNDNKMNNTQKAEFLRENSSCIGFIIIRDRNSFTGIVKEFPYKDITYYLNDNHEEVGYIVHERAYVFEVPRKISKEIYRRMILHPLRKEKND